MSTSCDDKPEAEPEVTTKSRFVYFLQTSSNTCLKKMETAATPHRLTRNELRELEHCAVATTIVSALLLVPLLVINVWLKERRGFPSRMWTLYMACTFGVHVTVLVGLATQATSFLQFTTTHRVSESCTIQGVFYQFFVSSMIWLWVLVCTMLYCVVVKEMRPRDLQPYEVYTHICWIGLASVQTAIPFLRESAEPEAGVPVCWLAHHGGRYFNKLAFFLSEMCLCLFLGGIMIFRILGKLWILQRRLSSGGIGAARKREVLLDHMVRHSLILFFFFFVFIILAGCTLFEYRASIIPKFELPYWVYLMHVICATGLGTFTFIAVGATSKMRCPDAWVCQCHQCLEAPDSQSMMTWSAEHEERTWDMGGNFDSGGSHERRLDAFVPTSASSGSYVSPSPLRTGQLSNYAIFNREEIRLISEGSFVVPNTATARPPTTATNGC
jgi:hypothetical protein